MRDILGESLRMLKKIRIRRRRLIAIVLILSLVVSMDVFWWMRQPGLTLAGDADCRKTEHTHDAQCVDCILEEHVHSLSCYSDDLADVETLLDWQKMFADYPFTGDLQKDLLGIAKMQVGYTESKQNFEVDDAGVRHGYTRYGAWYGAPYGKWSAMFVSFCLHYAGADSSKFPYNTGAATMAELWNKLGNYAPAGEYVPTAGDLVFFADNTVGIVTEVQSTTFCFILADVEDAVVSDMLTLTDPSVTGWGLTSGVPPDSESPPETTPVETSPPETTPTGTSPPETTPAGTSPPETTPAGTSPPETTPAGTSPPETTPVETSPPETTPAGTSPPETTPAGTSPPETTPTGTSPPETTPAGTSPPETTPIGTSPPETTPTGTSPPETTPTGTSPPETLPTETGPPGTSPPENDLLDISNGPAFFIFEGGETGPPMQTFALRRTISITDLVPYLDANGGSYFFTLLDKDNHELSKDENGNYIAISQTGYKLTLTFNSPKGFLPGTYQYQVPDGLLVDGGEGSFVLKDGTNVGSWTVTDSGLITFVFNDNIKSRTDITISSTLGIHFPENEDPIDFDGKISVTVQKPPAESEATQLTKWGIQGDPNATNGKTDPTKIYWNVSVTGHADSNIPGNVITDKVVTGDWIADHHYTQSDMDAGIRFGASDPAYNWHAWTVYPGDPNLTWTESGWSYKIPETISCWCGQVTLGNEGWIYYADYSSTPDTTTTAGTLYYMNRVTVDNQYVDGGASFAQGEVLGEVFKTGTFVSDAGGGAFLWEFQAVIPGRQDGEFGEYHWYLMDYMHLLNSDGNLVGPVKNDANLATVTATFNDTTVVVPKIQDATDADMFAWDNAWTANNNGVDYGQEINLLCRCQCNEETCQFWNGDCQEYWFDRGDGVWITNGFCQCWTPQENVTFTFVYKTEDLSMLQAYGGIGYQLLNVVELYYKPGGVSEGALASSAQDSVPIPGLFEKVLTHDFNGYTANYRITINEGKLVLSNGLPVTIRDEMTQTLTYISGSLVITAEDKDGNVTTLRQDLDYTVSYDGTGNKKDANGKPVHLLEIVLLNPQPVMYTLDYDTTLIIPDQVTEAIRYTNSATISLWGQDITDDTVEKVYADINIAAKNFKVEMYKTAGDTGEPLSGATFGMYNEHGGLITTDVTDENGQILFQTNVVEGIILREHVLYYMQELDPPPGFKLDSTKYWICFCSEEWDGCPTCEKILAGTNAVRIPFEQVGSIRVVNERMDYNLPATGGSGVYPVLLVSAMFIITPLVYMFVQRRKRERRGVG